MRRTDVHRMARASGWAIVWACCWAAAAAGADEARPTDPAIGGGRAWLGVWSGDAVDGGAQILAVVSGGPAEQGGLRVGDIVIEVAGRTVASEADLGQALRALAPGDEAPLGILREGRRLALSVRLAQRAERPRPKAVLAPDPPLPPSPPAAPGPGRIERAGFAVTEIGPALRAHYGAPGDAGVLVTRVEAGSAAATAGLDVGDVLLRIAERPIRTEDEVRGNLVRWNATRPLRLEVIRAGRPAVLTLVDDPSSSPSAESPQIAERRLRAEIDRLERRLAELRRELERMRQGD